MSLFSQNSSAAGVIDLRSAHLFSRATRCSARPRRPDEFICLAAWLPLPDALHFICLGWCRQMDCTPLSIVSQLGGALPDALHASPDGRLRKQTHVPPSSLSARCRASPEGRLTKRLHLSASSGERASPPAPIPTPTPHFHLPGALRAFWAAGCVNETVNVFEFR